MSDYEEAGVVDPPPPMLQNVPFPPKLEMRGNLANNWKRFKRVWCNYEIASRLIKQGNEERTATLLTCLGPDALEMVDGLSFASDEERTNPDIVIQKLETFCIGETNETYERYQFNKWDQELNKSIDSYVAVLRNLAKTCNYCTLEENLIRDRIVMGIRENSTRKRLLQESELTLNRCIDICRANESTAIQLKAIGNEEDVNVVKKKSVHGSKGAQKRVSKDIDCKYCGRKHIGKKEDCPAWGKSCSKCGMQNHFAVECRSEAKRQTFHAVYEDNVPEVFDDYSSAEEYIFAVETDKQENVQYNKKLFATMIINSKQVQFQLDTGATVNVLSVQEYKEISNDQTLAGLSKSNATLCMYNNTVIKPIGKVRLSVRNPKNNKKYNIEFQIVKEENSPVLGAKTIQGMQLITLNLQNVSTVENSVEGNLTRKQVVSEYKEVFKGEGQFSDVLHLQVDPNVPPVQLPPRKPPIAFKANYKQELDKLTKLVIIKPVVEPTEWISATVMMLKPNGKVRLCLDPKPLDKALKRSHYPLPVIEEVLPDLSKAKVFSMVDVKDWFWHVPEEESSKLTTSATPWGRYMWLKMPFGISVAPEEFQRRLSDFLLGLNGVKTVADDIIVFGVRDSKDEAMKDHDRNFKSLLERCLQRNIKLNEEKMKFKVPELKYVGHVISEEGLKPDPKKVEAVIRMPPPEDKQQLRRFMGMTNYLQKFAPHLSQVNAPLRMLLKDNTEFKWDSSIHGKCFTPVKKIITEAPVLKFYNPTDEVTIQCDASQYGLGACLMQNGHPIAYASRSLTNTESNYAQIEKELLAIVFGAERFESYLYGRKFTVESDHKPLEAIMKKSVVSAPKRLQRMIFRLQRFDFDIIYKKGSEIFLADMLSRSNVKGDKGRSDRDIVCDVFMADKERSYVEREIESINMLQYLSASEEGLKKVQRATEQDREMSELKRLIQEGWPEEISQVPESMRCYYSFREELISQEGLIFKGDRLVIPKALREDMMQRMHRSHLGIQGCLSRGREVMYWPRMNEEVKEFISRCEVCRVYQDKQQKEPMIGHDIPSRPWQKVGSDLFELQNGHFLVCVDYYSDFIEVDKIYDKKGKSVISKLKSQFARHGIPN